MRKFSVGCNGRRLQIVSDEAKRACCFAIFLEAQKCEAVKSGIETPKDVCVSLKDVTSSLSGLFLSEKPKSYRRIM